jgi:hypothetical protein
MTFLGANLYAGNKLFGIAGGVPAPPRNLAGCPLLAADCDGMFDVYFIYIL